MTTGQRGRPDAMAPAATGDGTRRRSVLGFGLALTALGMGGCGGGSAPVSVASTPAGQSGARAAALSASARGAPGAPGAGSMPAVNFAPPPVDAWTASYGSFRRGRAYFVAVTGSDTADGSVEQPWRTIQHAIGLVAPGETVVINDGTYEEQVFVQRSGLLRRYIAIRAANPGKAMLVGPAGSYSALKLQNAAYIRIEGLDVRAAAGHGIEAETSHHIQIVGNTCHDCGGSGISLERSDYLLVEANVCVRNASTNVFQTSGISIYQPQAVDIEPGFHIIVRRNVSCANVESATGLGRTSEGNGIILDDFHNSQDSDGSGGNQLAGNYGAATLVENNLVAYNGGGGIVAYESDHVWVRNNTTFRNNTDPLNSGTYRGELSSVQCSDGHWFNNIAVADSSGTPAAVALLETTLGSFANAGSEWGGNLLYDMAAPQRDSLLVSGNANMLPAAMLLALNTFRQDPAFAGGNAPAAVDDFRLRSDSPAVNGAIAFEAASVDFDNLQRDAAPDCGALEAA